MYKRILSCLMIIFVLISLGIFVHATDSGGDTKSSNYTISIPKTIVLNGETGKAEYEIEVSGDLADLCVSVISDKEFKLSSFDKEDVVATVNCDKELWSNKDVDTNANGTISADLTAGNWAGVLNFTVRVGYVVPEGCTYYVGVGETPNRDYTGATEIYYEGEIMPPVATGDVLASKDYEYRYNMQNGDYGWTTNNTMNGWGVRILNPDDRTRVSYEDILAEINGEPIVSMKNAFWSCQAMLAAPAIPATVVDMDSAFEGCKSLTTIPQLPPEVVNLTDTFRGCTSLVGTIEISVNPTIYENCFKDTELDIYLTGSSSVLKELAATDGFEDYSENDNVRIFENHDYVITDTKFDWSDDYNSASAIFECTKCHDRITKDATITHTTTDATCLVTGQILHEATVNFNDETYSDSCIQVIPALGHIDEDNDGMCDRCGETLVTVEGLGNIAVSDPNVEIQYDPTTNKLMATRPPVNNQPETPEEIPAEKLPELIEFNYGTFESSAIYNPEEYVTVEYQTTKTRLKPPVPHIGIKVALWKTVKTTENGQTTSKLQPVEILLSDIGKTSSTYLVYTFEIKDPLFLDGIEGKAVETFTIGETEDDTLENAIYIAAYYNKLEDVNTYHVAKWDGTQYVKVEVDNDIANVKIFTETYVETTTKQVVVKGPSYSTEYVYVPVGILKAVKDMTWAEWLKSEYNTLGVSDIIIRNSEYEIVSISSEIIANESYSFVEAPPVDYDTLIPGLYKSGSNYTEMVMDWETLINEGWFKLSGDHLLHHCDNSEPELCSFAGDLVISKDAGIHYIANSGGFMIRHNGLTGVVLPEGLILLCDNGQYAFSVCENLTTVVFPEGLQCIGPNTFSLCKSLNNVIIPDSVETIGGGAFADCTSLTNIKLSNNLTTIEKLLFNGCSNLETIVLPDSVTSIKQQAFFNCYALKNINIPSNTTRIAANAFEDCNNLTSVTFEGDSKWYYTDSSDYTNGIEVDVSDPAVAAAYLKTYSDKYWYSEQDSGGSDPCVTGDTLITLADGTKKRIDEITYDDKLMVWDSFNGKFTESSAAIIFDHGVAKNTVIELTFSDGTVVKVVNLHQFMDVTLNKFVSITAESVEQYVGHEFMKQGNESYTTVELTGYKISEEEVEAWGIISATHYNILVEGMVSTDFMLEDYDLFNYFEYGENMTFDSEKMRADIEKYGLYTYEEFAEYLTPEQFAAFNVQYMKIAVGKGTYTYEKIIELIQRYIVTLQEANIPKNNETSASPTENEMTVDEETVSGKDENVTEISTEDTTPLVSDENVTSTSTEEDVTSTTKVESDTQNSSTEDDVAENIVEEITNPNVESES